MIRPFHCHDWRAAHDGDGWRCAGCGQWADTRADTAETSRPLRCRIGLHRWGLATRPLMDNWCQRCGKHGIRP